MTETFPAECEVTFLITRSQQSASLIRGWDVSSCSQECWWILANPAHQGASFRPRLFSMPSVIAMRHWILGISLQTGVSHDHFTHGRASLDDMRRRARGAIALIVDSQQHEVTKQEPLQGRAGRGGGLPGCTWAGTLGDPTRPSPASKPQPP